MWATNVGTDYGQVSMSVLTTGEGYGPSPTIHRLIRRYKEAEVPPLISFIMTGTAVGIINLEECFRTVNTVGYLALMRRLSVGCTTDAHALYATFMSRLNQYIYLI